MAKKKAATKKAAKKPTGKNRRRQKDVASLAAVRDCKALNMHLEGYTTRQIAEQLDMNDRTVYKAIDRGREAWKMERVELHQDLVETVLMTQRRILSLAFQAYADSKSPDNLPGDPRFLALAEKASHRDQYRVLLACSPRERCRGQDRRVRATIDRLLA